MIAEHSVLIPESKLQEMNSQEKFLMLVTNLDVDADNSEINEVREEFLS